MQFVRIVVTRCDDAAKNVAELRVVVDEAQQRLAASADLADTEDVLGGRIETDDEQVLVKQNDARTQAVEYVARIVSEATAIAGALLRAWLVVA